MTMGEITRSPQRETRYSVTCSANKAAGLSEATSFLLLCPVVQTKFSKDLELPRRILEGKNVYKI